MIDEASSYVSVIGAHSVYSFSSLLNHTVLLTDCTVLSKKYCTLITAANDILVIAKSYIEENESSPIISTWCESGHFDSLVNNYDHLSHRGYKADDMIMAKFNISDAKSL